jgi:chloramphenicol-sensitive protein RarD
MGVIVFRERLRAVQWLAMLLAAAGVAYLIYKAGLPWIALALAVSFALYGLIRKVAPVETLLGLGVETFLLAPASLALLLWRMGSDQIAMGKLGWQIDVLVLLSGVATTVPLFFFGQAARKLPMSMLGFLQYLGPSLQLLQAVLWYGEDFDGPRQVSFTLIWSALALVIADSALRMRGEVTASTGPPRPDTPRSDPSPAAGAPAASRP